MHFISKYKNVNGKIIINIYHTHDILIAEMKRRIAVTTGSRSDYGLLRPVLKKILLSKKLELFLIVTGMHLSKKYGFTINEIKKDGFKISAMIKMEPPGNSMYGMAKSLGDGTVEFANIFKKYRPDINLVLGDRDEMLASSLAAYHMNIPNAHIHGGEKSGGIDEYTRHAITKISNIHFAVTKKSKERIIRMGENPRYVILTGSPGIDEVLHNEITSKQELERIYHYQFNGEEILLLQHPVTTESENSEQQIKNILKALVLLKRNVIAIAPNSDAGNEPIFQYLTNYSKKYDFIKMYRNIPRTDYLGMLRSCGVLVGNSSSGLIESGYFDIPVVNIGIRQKKREHGSNVINIEKESSMEIYRAIKNALKLRGKTFSKEFVYGNGTASIKIVRYLEKINLKNDLINKQISY